MNARIVRVLSASVAVALLAGAIPTVCEGWSLLSPFSSDTKPDPRRPISMVAQKQPSTMDKVGTGTKNFFNKTGETLGLKKPDPKRPLYAVARPPTILPPKKTESKSWVSSLSPFKSSEPEKPKTVRDWMSNKRLDP